MILPNRTFSSESYRYGWNGHEKDEEFTGSQSHYNFGARIYDGRIGRFLSIDPLSPEYPMWSPYQYAANSPISTIDIYGLGPGDAQEHTTPDGGSMTLPSSSTVTKFSSDKTYSVGGKEIRVAEESVQSFIYNDNTYTAQFDKETGKFTKYLGSDGTELSYTTNTLPDVSNSGEYFASHAGVAGIIALSDGPEPFIADAVAVLYYGGIAIGAIWSVKNLLDAVSVSSPAIPFSGFVDETDAPPVAVPIPHGNSRNNPNPHIVYEIWGIDAVTGSRETLKYGIADSKYNTYGGSGNSRPTSQLANLRSKYPNMMLTYTIWSRTQNRGQALFVEGALVTQYVATHGKMPPEQLLPNPIK